MKLYKAAIAWWYLWVCWKKYWLFTAEKHRWRPDCSSCWWTSRCRGTDCSEGLNEPSRLWKSVHWRSLPYGWYWVRWFFCQGLIVGKWCWYTTIRFFFKWKLCTQISLLKKNLCATIFLEKTFFTNVYLQKKKFHVIFLF